MSSEVKYSYKYVFEDTTGLAIYPENEVTFGLEENNVNKADSKAYELLADKFETKSLSSVKNDWRIKKREVEFDDPPWKNKSIIDEFTSLDQIWRASEKAPNIVDKQVIKIQVMCDDEDKAREQLLQYYSGLRVRDADTHNSLIVIITPEQPG